MVSYNYVYTSIIAIFVTCINEKSIYTDDQLVICKLKTHTIIYNLYYSISFKQLILSIHASFLQI